MLKVENLDVFYGDLQALRGISLEVEEGEIVTIIGSNGAGKSTTIKAISGMLRARKGSISWDNRSINQMTTSAIVEKGIIQIPEGRQLFPSMSVLENLELGALNPKAQKDKAENLKKVFGLFPRLEERKNQSAGTLSGGEQQMLAIGRGLMSRPRILMLDEPSLGLSPLLVRSIFRIIRQINREGTTILLVEQNIHYALNMAQRAYILENGEIVKHGPARELLQDDHIRQAYLGM
ncbi:MAG: ABC transporter ATP-binding protein [Deltaproteobacteria bacterium RBG_13_43_22]|nr:MAG: ABC transporter ATP-binding protein [Deltaproteobacteria bacterium RBG_13_43_22]